MRSASGKRWNGSSVGNSLDDGFSPTVTTRNRDRKYASMSPKNRIGTAGVTRDRSAAARPYERHAPSTTSLNSDLLI